MKVARRNTCNSQDTGEAGEGGEEEESGFGEEERGGGRGGGMEVFGVGRGWLLFWV